ncbi:MAG: Serine/threonine-protein kinase PknB, partial [Planctomycetota bacterium]
MTLRHDDDATTSRATRDATNDASIVRANESPFDGTPTKRGAQDSASIIATETEVARAFLSDDWMRRTAQATRHDANDQSLGQLAGYRLTRIVQRGVQGTVYEAVESRTDRRVAIKRLPLHDATSIESARFARETEALAVLRHPNIVSLLAAPSDDGARLLVMEWIDGIPLDRWADETWARLGARDATTAIVVCLEKVASAVASAHARGIMHRDLKPSNVLILPTGEPKVLDFGLAKALTGAAEVTRANGFAGTPAWAAPEQVTGDPRDIDARTDVHGLGLLLYRALAGRTAFDGTLPILPLFEAIKTATPVPPSRERKSVARELDCITLRALEKEPARRYQSAESLARDLARYLSGEPIDAHPPSAWYIARKFVRRHRAVTALAAIAAAAVVGGTALSTV